MKCSLRGLHEPSPRAKAWGLHSLIPPMPHPPSSAGRLIGIKLTLGDKALGQKIRFSTCVHNGRLVSDSHDEAMKKAKILTVTTPRSRGPGQLHSLLPITGALRPSLASSNLPSSIRCYLRADAEKRAEERKANISFYNCAQREVPMYRVRHYVGPPWPPTLAAYDYTRTLARRDWAWEGLRRDPAYQDEARAHLDVIQDITRLESGALITRMHGPSPRAEAWALRSFR